MAITVHHGDCLDVLPTLPESTVEAVITDPPYDLGIARWDSGVAFQAAVWRECLRVLKPGGHLLAFGHARTWHRVAVSIEDAGAEIRDSIAWIYGSGLPKSVGALKPAFEPIIVARKPSRPSAHLNIEACRVGTRWPPNVLLDELTALDLDGQTATMRAARAAGAHKRHSTSSFGDGTIYSGGAAVTTRGHEGAGASRFFPAFRYQPKAAQSERPMIDGVTHPTVKPLDLMRWLVRLVTPPGGTVLDPYLGSGTTAQAALVEGMHCIGIEQCAAYLPLIEARLRS